MVRERVDGDVRRLPRPQVGELRLLEVRVDIDVLERHQRHQPRARLHIFARLGRAVADDAVEGRAHDRVVEIELRLVDGKLVLIEDALAFRLLGGEHGGVRFGRRHPGARGVDCGVGLQQLGSRGVNRLLRTERLVGKRGGAIVFDLGVGGAGLGGGELRASLRHLRLAGGDLLIDAGDGGLLNCDLRLGLLEREAVVGIVDEKKRRPCGHAGVVGDRDGLDVARDLGRDHRSVRAHIGVVGRDHEAPVRPPAMAEIAADSDHGDEECADQRQPPSSALRRGGPRCGIGDRILRRDRPLGSRLFRRRWPLKRRPAGKSPQNRARFPAFRHAVRVSARSGTRPASPAAAWP